MQIPKREREIIQSRQAADAHSSVSNNQELVQLLDNPASAAGMFHSRMISSGRNEISHNEELAKTLHDLRNEGFDTRGSEYAAAIQTGNCPMNLNERSSLQQLLGPPSAALRTGEHIRCYDSFCGKGTKFSRNSLSNAVSFEDSVSKLLRESIRKSDVSDDLSNLKRVKTSPTFGADVADYVNDISEDGDEPNAEDCLKYLLKLI